MDNEYVLSHYEDFKTEVLKLTKIDLSAYKEKQMRRRIETLVEKNECSSYKEYIKKITKDRKAYEEFVNYLTINVSEFYRNTEQWNLLINENLPKLISRFGGTLKVWSAACSTGDEPYSLVMALSEKLDIRGIRILATDLDKQVIAQAKTGIYSGKSIAGVPDKFKTRYFEKIGEDSYKISDEIKRHVEFKEHNLLRDPYPKGYHLIVCRNVLIYFTEEAKHEIYEKFNESLNKGGMLFIGSTEQVMDYKDIGYKRLSSFYYEKDV